MSTEKGSEANAKAHLVLAPLSFRGALPFFADDLIQGMPLSLLAYCGRESTKGMAKARYEAKP